MPTATAAAPSPGWSPLSSSPPEGEPRPIAVPEAEPRPFAIYVHWPFCRSKCPYCDFNSHVREAIDEAAWAAALERALDAEAARTAGRTVETVFFGGGTPSLMAPATVGRVLDRIARHWAVAADVEVTLEANPTSAEAGRFQGFRAAGVNRLSLGVQALDPAALAFLGRAHDAAEARAAIVLAARHFRRFSFDLIYARPGQGLAAWLAELDQALDLAADHLSLYQLTIEPGTRFFAEHRRRVFDLPDEQLAADLLEATGAHLAQAGLPAYEISNHARPGAECRHNLVYWRYGDYLGVGPGAHGRLTLDGAKLATRQFKVPETWLAAVAAGSGSEEEVLVDDGERLIELLMTGLRLAEGIPRARFRRELGAQPEALLPAAALADLAEAGFLALDADCLTATAAGRQRLNAVLQHLVG